MTDQTCSQRGLMDWKRLKSITIWVFAIGLVFHGYSYLNGNFSHDSLYSIYEESPELMISVGRYLRPVYRLLRGNFTLPVINGVLSLIFLALSAYFILDMLNIQSRCFTVLSCGILVGNTTVALMNATFLHDADAYALALLLAVLGVWVSRKSRGGIWLSVPFYFASLGIYQAYIDCAVYLILILALLALLEGEPVKRAYGLAFRRLLAVGAGMVLYFLGTKLVPAITGIRANQGYNTVYSLSGLNVQSLLDRAEKFFLSEAIWFYSPNARLKRLIFVLNIVFVLLAVWLVRSALKKQQAAKGRVWAVLGVVAAIPFGMNLITPVSNLFHALTIYSFFLSYLLVIALAERAAKWAPPEQSTQWAGKLCGILAAVLLFDSCIYAQTIYLEKEMVSDATLSLMTRLLDRMEQTDGYVVDETPIAIVGRLRFSDLQTERPGMPSPANGMGYSYATTYFETYEKYINYYLGYPAQFLRGPRLLELEETETVRQMPQFPAPGSVLMVEDVLVVKFSQPFHEAEIF
ncbi:MAG: glucosyltransferase domain-containing protein [Faecousia sp.]